MGQINQRSYYIYTFYKIWLSLARRAQVLLSFIFAQSMKGVIAKFVKAEISRLYNVNIYIYIYIYIYSRSTQLNSQYLLHALDAFQSYNPHNRFYFINSLVIITNYSPIPTTHYLQTFEINIYSS